MVNILLVDDESYVTESLALTIPWEQLRIQEVYRADSVDQALELMNRHDIDIVVTDIRMPDRDGLELLSEVSRQWPDVRTMVLTGHSDFEYAQKAIRLKASDYILKPVDDEQFIKSVSTAVQAIEQEWGQLDRYNQLSYRRQSELELLRESLLSDLLLGREPGERELLTRLENYEVALRPGDSVRMLFIPTSPSLRGMEESEARLLEYAAANIAAEVLSGERPLWSGRAPHNGLIMLWRNAEQDTQQEDQQMLESFVDNAGRYLKLQLAVYVSEVIIFPDGLASAYRQMLRFAQWSSVAEESQIHYLQPQHYTLERPAIIKYMEPLYRPPTLIHLLESGQWNTAREKLTGVLDSLESLPLTHEQLYEVYLAVSNALVYMAHHHGHVLGASDSGGLDPFAAQHITGSLDRLRSWCMNVLTRMEGQRSSTVEPSRSRIVKQVQEIVAENLGQDVSVKHIADRVFLHPVYLSKIYKSETGEGLGDYIIRIRMEKALYLLKHTNRKIYEITAELGYQNPQYFSKLFKKHYGMTPNEFRDR
ncbi:response regulator [Paenibacillus wulumuqiensis]|uniref:response regulator n=1 Tax=Paenibacillus wulumuqiensis TaxID=1567107 RepID=UPI0006192FA6|nr:response regulator [Paenibacillus wulumuqiensis]